MLGAMAAALVLAAQGAMGHAGESTRPPATTPAEAKAAAPAPASALRRGINLSGWFAQAGTDPKAFFPRIQAPDLARIRAAGFDHVRLVVDPLVLVDWRAPGRLRPQRIALLEKALAMIRAADLAVILAPYTDNDLRMRGLADPAEAQRFRAFWEALAAPLRDSDPAFLYPQLINEPALADPEAWNREAHALAARLRARLPRHTLLIPASVRVGDDWNAFAALQRLRPVADPKVAYTLHIYMPELLTHQGATWSNPALAKVKHVPYPSTPEKAEALIQEIGLRDKAARAWVERYGAERWNRDRMAALLDDAVAWAARHEVPLHVSEYGVFAYHGHAADRLRWQRDVRELLEARGVGWTVWDYSDGWGLLQRAPPADPKPAAAQAAARAFDPETLRALGLRR